MNSIEKSTSQQRLPENIAYIDATNLDKALKGLKWKLDYKKFRV